MHNIAHQIGISGDAKTPIVLQAIGGDDKTPR